MKIRDANPPVSFFVDPLSRPNSDLEDQLVFDQADHALVGIVHGALYSQECPNVLLLTDDTGVIAVADAVGVPFAEPLASWKTPGEITDEEREISQLKEAIAELAEVHPRFEVACFTDDESVKTLEIEFVEFAPLSEGEIASAINTLETRLPPGTTFVQRAVSSNGDEEQGIAERKDDTERNKNAEEKVIAGGASYEQWVRKCKEVLTHLHESLHRQIGQPWFYFSATNLGNCPADQVLVRMRVSGRLKIARPRFRIHDESDFEPSRVPELPMPPLVKKNTPQFALTSLFDISPSAFEVIGRGLAVGPLISAPSGEAKRDPNDFFYRGSSGDEPVEFFELTCEQWRHGDGAEEWHGRIFPGMSSDRIEGSLTIEIHAANLPQPFKSRFPVRLATSQRNAFDHVQEVTQDLIQFAC